MPNIPLIILPEMVEWAKAKMIIEEKLGKHLTNPAQWVLSDDPRLASRELYQDLRKFSSLGHDAIIIRRNSHQTDEDWKGIWNRLNKAKTFEVSTDLSVLE